MKKGNILAYSGVAAVVIFLIGSTWILSRPLPFEIQGEVETTQIKVASKLVGRIDSLPIHKGDMVEKGDLLFTLKSPEIDAKLQQAHAALHGAEAQNKKAINGAQEEDIDAAHNVYLKALAAYELADKTYQRVLNLYNEGVVPAQKRDEAETQLKVSLETANAAKAIWIKAQKGARYEDKEAANALVDRAEGVVNEIESYLSETAIYAPVSGEIANILAESGELIPAGFPIVTIAKPEDSWVTFNMREDLLADIKKGSILQAKFPALGNKTINLEITYINILGNYATWNATKTSGDFDMKTFEVHAKPVTPTSELRAGMSAIVDWKSVSRQ